jgi:hypothetical protein
LGDAGTSRAAALFPRKTQSVPHVWIVAIVWKCWLKFLPARLFVFDESKV